MTQLDSKSAKRRPINLTIREDVMKEARALNLNTSQAAEAGISQAIKAARQAQWIADNSESIEAHNNRIESKGVLIKPNWVE